ncbi:MAG: FAD-dependent oxidoreductase, partial [Nitrospirota bacterium]
MATVTTEPAPILVIGGGIAGLTAANEAAETGNRVIIVEKEPYLGGRAIRLAKYFPKLCPPYCGFEINLRRIKQNPDVTVHTLAQVEGIQGQPGDYTVTIRKEPRYVNQRCTACGDCVPVCPEERPNDFNYGMDTTKAIYLPHDMAFPMKYALDMVACQGSSCNKCVEVCQYDAIDLAMQAETIQVKVAAVVVATGWKPYDPSRMDNLGFGSHPDILSNVMFERLA